MLIKTDGTLKYVEPRNGEHFELDELRSFVEGYIELLNLGDRFMVVNEEGKLLGKPVNDFATLEAQNAGINDIIVGDVLICKMDKIR